MSDIGIVVVTYNSAREIGACLDAALASGAEIVVVDNASADGTVAEAARRNVRVIANSSNRGFAAAANQGFAAVRCGYVLLLNPDTVLESSLEPLRDACDRPGAGGAGGCLVDETGRQQVGFMVRALPTPGMLILEALLLNRIWPNNPVNSRYRCLHLDYCKLQAVEQPAGAFLMIRRAVWEQLGGFDEHFWPLWFEDVDFCCRAVEHGYLLYYVPDAVAKHTGAHSIASLGVEMRRVYWYRGFLRYSAKHFRLHELWTVCLAVMAGSLLRMILESAAQKSLRPIGIYGQVVRLAGHVLSSRRDDAVTPVVPNP